MYNPQIQNALSQVGAQGLGGSSGANPAGPAIAPPSGQSGGITSQRFENDLNQSVQVENDANNFSISFTDGESAPVTVPLGAIAGTADLLANLIEDLFSGPDNPPVPRQLMHKRHPLYGEILGIQGGIIPTEGPSVPATPTQTPPLRSPDFVTTEVNVGGLAGISVDFSIDRYGHRYIGIGAEVGKSLSIVSYSVSAGWLNEKATPSAENARFSHQQLVQCRRRVFRRWRRGLDSWDWYRNAGRLLLPAVWSGVSLWFWPAIESHSGADE